MALAAIAGATALAPPAGAGGHPAAKHTYTATKLNGSFLTTTDIAYGVTSLKPAQADAKRLLGLVRGHWGIENGLFYVRDVTMGEDANRTRTGSGPQALAALRNAAISHLRLAGSDNIAASLRRNAARVGELLKSLRILKN